LLTEQEKEELAAKRAEEELKLIEEERKNAVPVKGISREEKLLRQKIVSKYSHEQYDENGDIIRTADDKEEDFHVVNENSQHAKEQQQAQRDLQKKKYVDQQRQIKDAQEKERLRKEKAKRKTQKQERRRGPG
jgi:hypothetical protein